MFPSFAQFSRWSGQHRAVPLWIEPELPAEDLLEWVHSLAASRPHCFFLHSAGSGAQSRYSYVSLDAPRYRLECTQGALAVHYEPESGGALEALKVGNPLERFHQWLTHFTAPRVDGLPPFWGGAVGFFGYESGRFLDAGIAKALRGGRRAATPESFPDFEFGIYDAVAVVDHARRRLWLVHTVLLPERKTLSPLQLERLYRLAQDRLRRYAVTLQKAVHRREPWGAFEASAVQSNRSEAAYRLMVRRAKGLISAGELYQCNLSQTFSARWRGDPWALYRELARINPSPYAALWRSKDRWMVSASPELLLRQEADHVETRPIAGTYPRARMDEDQPQLLEAMAHDAKERAEHIMLVDLERNDLSRVCASPSVRVAESLLVEKYSHVLHFVSDIRGQLSPGKDWKDVLAACFPGGTITGCPKIRCMEAIRKIEAAPRGPYCGSLGWIGFNGDMTLNILIRTLFLQKGTLSFPAGAGIVADSDPPREYHETLHKAQALLQALRVQPPVKAPRRKRS
jgi:anthranilate/para-aminobenzoate synthase component I